MRMLFGVVLAVLVAFAPSVCSADDLSGLLKESLRVNDGELQALRIDLDTYAVSEEMSSLNRLAREFRTSVERTVERRKEVLQLQTRLALLERVEAFVGSEAGDQKQLFAAANEKLQKLQLEREEAFESYRKNYLGLKETYATQRRQLATAMTTLFQERGERDFATIKRQRVTGDFLSCSATAIYIQNGVRLCEVTVRHGLNDVFGKPKEVWGDKLSLLIAFEDAVVVRAGEFEVSAAGVQKDMDTDKLKVVVQQLVDLESISKLTPTQELETPDQLAEIVKASVDVGKKASKQLNFKNVLSSRELQKQAELVKTMREAEEQSPVRNIEIQQLRNRLAFLSEIDKYAKGDRAAREKQVAQVNQRRKKQAAIKAKKMNVAKKKFAELNAEHSAKNHELSEALKQLFREQGKDNFVGIQRHQVKGDFLSTSGEIVYVRDSKTVLRVVVGYRQKPFTTRVTETWGDNVELVAAGVGRIYFRAGKFMVSVIATNSDDWNNNDLKVVAKQLVDFDAIAQLKLR